MFATECDIELIQTYFQGISREKKGQNLILLAHIIKEADYKSIESIYDKNVLLLKKNIKLLQKCPNFLKAIEFFKDIYAQKRSF